MTKMQVMKKHISKSNYDISGYAHPAREDGGDFYDI